MVAVVRRGHKARRTRNALANWARYPRPSEIDEKTRRDLARIEQAIVGGDVRGSGRVRRLAGRLE